MTSLVEGLIKREFSVCHLAASSTLDYTVNLALDRIDKL